MSECVFCHKEQIVTDFVYEDELVMAFMDMEPINEGHVLLVPKQHYLDADEIPDELLAHFDYFWLPNPQYTTKRSKEERLDLMKKDILENDNVVISGSLVDWGDELISLFTLVIRLVTDTEIRIERLKTREKQKFGDRIIPDGDMYTNHTEFIGWARKYDTGSVDMRSKAKHDKWQKLLQCRQIVLNGANDLEDNFEKVQAEINSVIGRTVTVTVDRPLGSYHPEHKDMYYPINYGYVEGIMAPDGEEQDAERMYCS